jgi:N4-gp56 family major capsid protein
MASSTNTESNNNLLMAYFERKALMVLHDDVRFYPLCEKKPLPLNSGTSVTFNAWRKIDAASSTLSEYSASANAMTALSSRKVTVTLASYGRGVEWTDTLELTGVLPVEPGALAELEQSAALTVDNIVQYAALKALFVHTGNSARCTSSILSGRLSSRASSFCLDTCATGSASIALRWGFPVVFGTSATFLSSVHAASSHTTSISANAGPIAVRKAVSRLKRLNVKPMANGKYAGVCHPNFVSSMLGNPDYKTWVQGYVEGPKETMYKHQVAEVHGVQFIESANMPRYQGNILSQEQPNLNITFICGQGALGMTELDGGIKFIYHDKAKTADPYELKSTLTYKVRAAACVLNPSAGVILITQDMEADASTIA